MSHPQLLSCPPPLSERRVEIDARVVTAEQLTAVDRYDGQARRKHTEGKHALAKKHWLDELTFNRSCKRREVLPWGLLGGAAG
jgi:hypothetical protein